MTLTIILGLISIFLIGVFGLVQKSINTHIGEFSKMNWKKFDLKKIMKVLPLGFLMTLLELTKKIIMKYLTKFVTLNGLAHLTGGLGLKLI